MLLSANNIAKSYDERGCSHKVFSALDLVVTAGSFHCIKGPSGSGKTTLLNCLAGLDSINSGSIDLFGLSLQSLNNKKIDNIRANDIGFIYQFHHLLLHLSVLDNVALPAIIAGCDVLEARDKALDLLMAFDLYSNKNNFANSLSGGERQRVAVARALVNKPKLIIADEPTGNLDQANAAIIIDYLYDYCKNFNTACILATHDNNCIRNNATVYQLLAGKLSIKRTAC